jgi:hypothetical protein
MATVIYLEWDGVTPEQYDAAREQVGWERDPAEGVLLHVAWFVNGGIRVTDVWESADHFQRFREGRLMPGVREVGIQGEPRVSMHDAYAIFTPAFEAKG